MNPLGGGWHCTVVASSVGKAPGGQALLEEGGNELGPAHFSVLSPIRTIALHSSGRRSVQMGTKSPPSADFHLWEGEWPGLEGRGVTVGRLWGDVSLDGGAEQRKGLSGGIQGMDPKG